MKLFPFVNKNIVSFVKPDQATCRGRTVLPDALKNQEKYTPLKNDFRNSIFLNLYSRITFMFFPGRQVTFSVSPPG